MFLNICYQITHALGWTSLSPQLSDGTGATSDAQRPKKKEFHLIVVKHNKFFHTHIFYVISWVANKKSRKVDEYEISNKKTVFKILKLP